MAESVFGSSRLSARCRARAVVAAPRARCRPQTNRAPPARRPGRRPSTASASVAPFFFAGCGETGVEQTAARGVRLGEQLRVAAWRAAAFPARSASLLLPGARIGGVGLGVQAVEREHIAQQRASRATASSEAWNFARSCAVSSPTSGMASACSQRASGSVFGALDGVEHFARVLFAEDARLVVGAEIERGELLERAGRKDRADRGRGRARRACRRRCRRGRRYRARRVWRSIRAGAFSARGSSRSRRPTRRIPDRAAPGRRTPGHLPPRCARKSNGCGVGAGAFPGRRARRRG